MKLLNQKHFHLIPFNLICRLVFLFLFPVVSIAQQDLEKYIPYEFTSEDTHPTIEIRTILHMIKFSESDARNLTEDSIAYLNQQYDWINSFYRDLGQPTLPTKDGITHYIPSARVKFKVEKILFHIDAEGWDRIKTIESENNPMEVMNYDTTDNTIQVKGNWKSFMFKAEDSLKLHFADGKKLTIHYNSISVQNKTTSFLIREKMQISELPVTITCFKESNTNCSLDLWEKYGKNDPNALHVFYTGSSKSGIAFGCGPAPYFLNVSNIIKGGDWAGAQLTAHELGHTIGLSHTDRPQFDDLPVTDKFGFIDCDKANTSNNIMGYNICRNYLSPKQVGYVHQLYSSKKERILLTTANEYIANEPIEIWENTIWEKAMIVRKDIVVRRGKTLEIHDQIHMAEGATIYLESKAKLIVDGAEILNFFGGDWKGLIICKSYERKHKSSKKEKNNGKVILLNEGKITHSKL